MEGREDEEEKCTEDATAKPETSRRSVPCRQAGKRGRHLTSDSVVLVFGERYHSDPGQPGHPGAGQSGSPASQRAVPNPSRLVRQGCRGSQGTVPRSFDSTPPSAGPPLTPRQCQDSPFAFSCAPAGPLTSVRSSFQLTRKP